MNMSTMGHGMAWGTRRPDLRVLGVPRWFSELGCIMRWRQSSFDADVGLDAAFGRTDDVQEEQLFKFIGKLVIFQVHAGLAAWRNVSYYGGVSCKHCTHYITP